MALILASGSSIRRKMLEAAGVRFDAVPPQVDEDAIKAGFDGEDPSLARSLAEAKSIGVTAEPGDCLIGSDSIVSVEGRRFSKPKDRKEAVEHLRFFRGKTMLLTSAVALSRNGKCEWSIADTARLRVRELTNRFIDDYLDLDWPDVGYTVGVFRMEGPGIQLFDTIEGDYFTILGMPLLPLLAALRGRGLMPS